MRAASAEPDREIVHANLAAVLRTKGLCDEAEREYREALRCDPTTCRRSSGSATLLLERGQPRRSRRAAPEGRPPRARRTSTPLWALARAQRLSGAAQRGRRDVSSASVELGAAEIWNEAGARRAERGQFDEAVRFFARRSREGSGRPRSTGRTGTEGSAAATIPQEAAPRAHADPPQRRPSTE